MKLRNAGGESKTYGSNLEWSYRRHLSYRLNHQRETLSARISQLGVEPSCDHLNLSGGGTKEEKDGGGEGPRERAKKTPKKFHDRFWIQG